PRLRGAGDLRRDHRLRPCSQRRSPDEPAMNGRSNGLRASAYAILVEIEESLGDPVLAALAARDIAAYVEPTDGPGGATRLNLYVDVLQRAAAGAVLAGMTPASAGE